MGIILFHTRIITTKDILQDLKNIFREILQSFFKLEKIMLSNAHA